MDPKHLEVNLITLSNAFLEFSANPELQNFSLASTEFRDAVIEHASFGLSLVPPAKAGFDLNSVVENPANSTVTLCYHDSSINLEFFVEFHLPQNSSFLFQRVWLVNNSAEIIKIDRFQFANVQIGGLRFSKNSSEKTAFFSNGWQSWSPSGSWQFGQRQTRSRLFPFSHPMLYDKGTPTTWQKNEFSSDMFAALIDHEAHVGLIGGFLSQQEQFGSFVSRLHPEPDLQVWANCDEVEVSPDTTLESDRLAWQFFNTRSPHPFDLYLQQVAQENQVKSRMQMPVGWCSWYYYFQNITPQVLQKNLETVKQKQESLPLDVFQIDDGYQKDVGSWLEFNDKFPDGLKKLSADIHKAGYTPGIWLAPFIVERHSLLVNEHPEWLLQKKKGRPVNSGFVWNNFGYALDLTHPEVQDYVRNVIRTAVGEWGFPYLKLDFLYAAALPGKHHNPSLTRAQILRQALELIRQAAGEQTTLLGCGCPLGPGIGIFEMMRISADVAPEWEPQFMSVSQPFRKEPNMPSARNAIQNILTRANLDPYLWVNDPDCLLVREDSNLSLPEVQSLASAISLTGGAFLISDDMTRLSPERLKIAASLLPPLPQNPEVKDLFTSNMPSRLSQTLTNLAGEWKLVALFNWQDRPADLTFDTAEWGLEGEPSLMREFWSGEIALVQGEHRFEQVPPHGVRLFAVKPLGRAVYLGSDLHISQGTELTEWQLKPTGLEFRLDLGRKTNGNCYLWMQNKISQVFHNGNPIPYRVLNKNIIQIPVELNANSPFRIRVNYD